MSNITRRDFSRRLALGAAGVAALGAIRESVQGKPGDAASGPKRPNFVFISSDQHSFRFARFMGHPLVRTPNLDKIAARGVVLENNYCGNPVCAPARSCMMTGMYSSDLNSFGNTTVYDGSYPTWGKRLKDAGYDCRGFGKMDLNAAYDLGFKGQLLNEHADDPDITELFRRPPIFRFNDRDIVNGKSRPERDKYDAEVAQGACNFITNESKSLNTPWAVYAGFYMPHPPFVGLKDYFDYYLPLVKPVQVPEKYLEDMQMPIPYQAMRDFEGVSTPIAAEKIARAYAGYFAKITEVDEYIGQVYDALEASGQLDNTYFIYTADHGEALGYNGLWLKNDLYEGAAHVPLIINGPGLTSGQRISQPTGHIDLVATMMEWAGLGPIKELRGTSLTPLLKGEQSGGPQWAYSESHSDGNTAGSCMIRAGDWKLMHFTWYGDYLFNLRDDPYEYKNLIHSADGKEKAAELQNKLHALVDPEKITMQAFNRQNQILEGYTKSLSEEKLFDLFKKRLGEGQGRSIAQKLKSGMLC
ncbi:MAG TPA: sulfatase-like hydrolase/transferase [Verrucomicrobiae bacterium]|jgi:choline-sulfatase